MEQEVQTMPNQYIPPPPTSLRQQIKAHKTRLIIIGVGLVLIIGMSTYLVLSSQQSNVASDNTNSTNIIAPPPTQRPPAAPQQTQNVGAETEPSPTPTLIPATAWKTYTNTTYGYSIKYPPTWTVQNLGALEPKVPSYVAFQPATASTSSRLITLAISTRTYQEQLALGASSSAITVAGITGTKQYFQDSNGAQSTAVILPRTNNLLILRAKKEYLTIFNLMLSTLTTTK